MHLKVFEKVIQKFPHGFSVGLPSPTFEMKEAPAACPSLFGWTASNMSNSMSQYE
jgi:hypothetical protein